MSIFRSEGRPASEASKQGQGFFIRTVNGDQYTSIRQSVYGGLLEIHRYQYLLINVHTPDHAALYGFDLDTTNRIFSLTLKFQPLQHATVSKEMQRLEVRY